MSRSHPVATIIISLHSLLTGLLPQSHSHLPHPFPRLQLEWSSLQCKSDHTSHLPVSGPHCPQNKTQATELLTQAPPVPAPSRVSQPQSTGSPIPPLFRSFAPAELSFSSSCTANSSDSYKPQINLMPHQESCPDPSQPNQVRASSSETLNPLLHVFIQTTRYYNCLCVHRPGNPVASLQTGSRSSLSLSAIPGLGQGKHASTMCHKNKPEPAILDV